MTETISPAEAPAAEVPHLARPHTDAAALRASDEATKDMPGRQRHIQDCVDQILARVDTRPAVG